MALTRMLYRIAPLFIFATILSLLLLLLLGGCGTVAADVPTRQPDANALPHLITQLDGGLLVNRGVLHPDQRIYFASEDRISMVKGTELDDQMILPNLNEPYGQWLIDIGIDPHSGLVYTIDRWTSVVYVIRNTTLITTLVGIVQQPEQIVVDEDSGEVYIFYTSQSGEKPQARGAIIAGTAVVTDMVLPAFAKIARYNPVDGHIYVAGYTFSDASLRANDLANSLTVIDNHQVITTILPLDDPQLTVTDIAINPRNGDVYVLLGTKLVYWDRVHAPRTVDLYAAGYKNLNCLTVEPKRGWAYVCAWTGRPSYVLAVDQDKLVAALPVAHWPAALAADVKHDYVYVAHYDPTNLSVLRGSKVITTLNIVGYGSSNVVVDEAHDYVYVANTDDGSISVFGFQDEAEQPSFWDIFLPWIEH